MAKSGKYRNLMSKRENLFEIFAEINDIQPKIKKLHKYDIL